MTKLVYVAIIRPGKDEYSNESPCIILLCANKHVLTGLFVSLAIKTMS